MPSPSAPDPAGRNGRGRLARRLDVPRMADVRAAARLDPEVLLDQVRSAQDEGRARLEEIVHADAIARAQAAGELLRVLSDQSAAVDDTNEVLGRILTGIVADLAALREEVSSLRSALLPDATPPGEAPAGAPGTAADPTDRCASR